VPAVARRERVPGDATAVVVGSGPNGLAAAVVLAQAGVHVTVVEGADTIGGGTRTAELTEPGFRHDVCSAVHPLGIASPFLASLPLERHGLVWVHPDVPLAHPLDGGHAAFAQRSLAETVDGLGDDGRAWRRIVGGTARRWDRLTPGILGPVARVPRHPVAMASFGLRAVRSAKSVASAFDGEPARALFGGCAAHAFLPLEHAFTASFGMLLAGSAHAVGWPFARTGSQAVADALAGHLRDLGGEIETGRWVRSLDDLAPADLVLLDVTPRQVLDLAGDALSGFERRRWGAFRYGPAAFKVDYALDGPIPWAAAGVDRAGTVHVGGPFEEIAAAERDVAEGRAAERPFLLVAQPSSVDPSRAPEGRHVAWVYGHVPHGYDGDALPAIEAQLERFAPGFRDRVLGRHVMAPADFEAYNPNDVGGDIAGGAHDGSQLILRPNARIVPYRTPIKGVYLCSASTPPGAGVHGMCGYHAARTALRGLRFGRRWAGPRATTR
jgi:phytoene dehydrogenase-like protein